MIDAALALLAADQGAAALAVARWTAKRFASSTDAASVHGSVAEAQGQLAEAATAGAAAIRLDPNNRFARALLERARRGREQYPTIRRADLLASSLKLCQFKQLMAAPAFVRRLSELLEQFPCTPASCLTLKRRGINPRLRGIKLPLSTMLIQWVTEGSGVGKAAGRAIIADVHPLERLGIQAVFGMLLPATATMPRTSPG